MRKKFFANVSWILIGKFVQVVIGFFVGIVSARYLGPSNYGLINYTASYVSFFSVLSGLGLDDYIMKEMIDHKDDQGTVLGSGILLRLLSSAFSLVALYGLLMIVEGNNPIIQALAFLQAINQVFGAFNLIEYWYQIQLRSKTTSIVTTISYLLMTVYRIYILMMQKDIRYFAFTGSLQTLFTAMIIFYLYQKEGGPKLRFSKEIAKDLVKNSYHFILSSLMVVIFNQTDKIMLKQILNETETGYYSIAANLCNMWPIFLMAIITSANPIIMEAKKHDEEIYKKRVRQCYAGVIYVSAIVSLGITILAPFIINTLYGPQYTRSIYSLQILTWSVLFSYLGVARGAWIVSEGLQKYVKYLTGVGAVANIIINWLLIPSLGATGASIATLLTQIIVNFLVAFFIEELRPNSMLIIDAFLLRGVIEKETINKIKDKFKRKASA